MEAIQYITPDGITYDLHAPGVRAILSHEGTGLPPIEYVTQRGPQQHGESLSNYFLRPRSMQVAIRAQGCSRSDYWNSRAQILDYLRPNRQTPNTPLRTGRLRIIQMPSGMMRDIDCLIQDGLNFKPRELHLWDEFSWTDVIRFIAFNPIAYDPTQRALTYNVAATELTFPITFPITFSGTTFSQNLSYAGTWIEYPTIVVTGPVSSFLITNQSTGQFLQFNHGIDAGQTLTVDLSYGRKTATFNDGTNAISFFTPDSNIGDFHIAPAPEVAGGVNAFQIITSGNGITTSLVMSYKHRFIGF